MPEGVRYSGLLSGGTGSRSGIDKEIAERYNKISSEIKKLEIRSDLAAPLRRAGFRNGESVMAHDVFISYSHKDKSCADAICAKLESEGYRCWYAPRDIAPGAEWASEIIDAIEGSKAFILIFSEHSNKSPQVLREITMAVENEIPIIPYKLSVTEPSKGMQYYLATVHWLDAFDVPRSKSIAALTDRVGKVLGKQPGEGMNPEEPEEEKPGPSKQPAGGNRKTGRKVLAGVLIGVILLAVIILWQTGAFKGKKEEQPVAPDVISGEAGGVAEEPKEEPGENQAEIPTAAPSEKPTEEPTKEPTEEPTQEPTEAPTEEPTEEPTEAHTEEPTQEPTEAPTEAPTETPAEVPAEAPAEAPTEAPTSEPAVPVRIADSVKWGDYGRVKLVEVVEWPQGTSMYHGTTSKPNGKWVVVVLAPADDAGIASPGAAINLGEDILMLDDFTVQTASSYGPTRLSPETKKMTLYDGGSMGFFFDVPDDYDPSRGVVTVNGTVLIPSGK